MAQIVKHNGWVEGVSPKDGQRFTEKEIKSIVGASGKEQEILQVGNQVIVYVPRGSADELNNYVCAILHKNGRAACAYGTALVADIFEV